MSAGSGHGACEVSLPHENRGGPERNGICGERRMDNARRVPRHQTEAGIERALPVIPETRLRAAGAQHRARHRTMMRPVAAAARGNTGIGVRAESRAQQ